MKNINKLFSVLLVFVLGMFLASTINVMAAGTTTATYPSGSGTTNMTEGNNAETIGLDPLIFYVESDKGGGKQSCRFE